MNNFVFTFFREDRRCVHTCLHMSVCVCVEEREGNEGVCCLHTCLHIYVICSVHAHFVSTYICRRNF
jgi:hypothetical protein